MAVKFYTNTNNNTIYYGNLAHRGDNTVYDFIDFDQASYMVLDWEGGGNKETLVFCDKPNNGRTPAQLRDTINYAIRILKNSAAQYNLKLDLAGLAIRHGVNDVYYRVSDRTVELNRPPSVPPKMFFDYKKYTTPLMRELLFNASNTLYDLLQSGNTGDFAIEFVLSEKAKNPAEHITIPAASPEETEELTWDRFDRAGIYLTQMVKDFTRALRVRANKETDEMADEKVFYGLVDGGLRSLARIIKISDTERMPFPLKHNSNYQTLNFFWHSKGKEMLAALGAGSQDQSFAGAIQKMIQSGNALLLDMEYIRDNPEDRAAWKSIDAAKLDTFGTPIQNDVEIAKEGIRHIKWWFTKINSINADQLRFTKQMAKDIYKTLDIFSDNWHSFVFSQDEDSTPNYLIERLNDDLESERIEFTDEIFAKYNRLSSDSSWSELDGIRYSISNLNLALRKIQDAFDVFINKNS